MHSAGYRNVLAPGLPPPTHCLPSPSLGNDRVLWGCRKVACAKLRTVRRSRCTCGSACQQEQPSAAAAECPGYMPRVLQVRMRGHCAFGKALPNRCVVACHRCRARCRRWGPPPESVRCRLGIVRHADKGGGACVRGACIQHIPIMPRHVGRTACRRHTSRPILACKTR
jgi:hypothetical protein